MITFHNTDQLRSFMKKESKRLGMNINNTYTTYFARLFLENLSKYNTGAVLIKGSAAETAYLGGLVRAVTDVDLALLEPIETGLEPISSVLYNESPNGIQFSFSRKPTISPTGIFKMSFDASFDRTKQPLGVDLQEEYNRLIELQERQMPAIFEGDEEFPVLVPSFEEYLAEKLCIIVESHKEDVLNTRVKDFYDIYRLHGGVYDPEKLTKYFGKMLALRGKVSLKDASTLHLDKNFIEKHKDLWEKARKKYDFVDDEVDLYGAVYYTRAVLREELQKNGAVMQDKRTPQPVQFVKQ